MIKVVLTGSESTGKTSLARELGAHFDAPVATEFVREFSAARPNGIQFSDHGAIAHGQIASEDAAIARAGDLVVLDTDLVSTVAYCEHYFGRAPQWIVDAARERAGHLYLLMKPDVDWVADGVRDRGERRDEMHALFESKLRAFGLRYVDIGGTWANRFAVAAEAISDELQKQKHSDAERAGNGN